MERFVKRLELGFAIGFPIVMVVWIVLNAYFRVQ